MFDVPVALILFRRSDTLPRIIARLREVSPKKIYLLADEGRNEKEIKEAHACRDLVENQIDWNCEIIKHYATENRGVYKNIGEGAKWVLDRERYAIFLEDDNLPEISFFDYAKELLLRYEDDPRIVWICGTNYLTEMKSENSYEFTQHLLPCGWASWASKFERFYDGELKTFSDKSRQKEFLHSFKNKWLAHWQMQSVRNEYNRYQNSGRFISWDYQMIWSIRSQNLLGIVPMRNQITNIGVDEFSAHGGNSKENIMTSRFCEVPSKPLSFPMIHPDTVYINEECDKALSEIICPPHFMVLKSIISTKIKRTLGIETTKSWKQIIRG